LNQCILEEDIAGFDDKYAGYHRRWLVHQQLVTSVTCAVSASAAAAEESSPTRLTQRLPVSLGMLKQQLLQATAGMVATERAADRAGAAAADAAAMMTHICTSRVRMRAF